MQQAPVLPARKKVVKMMVKMLKGCARVRVITRERTTVTCIRSACKQESYMHRRARTVVRLVDRVRYARAPLQEIGRGPRRVVPTILANHYMGSAVPNDVLTRACVRAAREASATRERRGDGVKRGWSGNARGTTAQSCVAAAAATAAATATVAAAATEVSAATAATTRHSLATYRHCLPR
jgi:hypothetical protein